MTDNVDEAFLEAPVDLTPVEMQKTEDDNSDVADDESIQTLSFNLSNFDFTASDL